MKNLIWVVILLPLFMMSQKQIEGNITENFKGKIVPILGANVYWENTTIGTVTDENGSFKIPYSSKNTILIISSIGYQTQKITVIKPRIITAQLIAKTDLNEVLITAEKKATQVSYLKVRNLVTINEKELLKAACCNLSESFETNPSIDVNFSDAVTGTKQIKMLGLTNPYILITQENIPSIRGASQAYGLTFTPGTWLESIQITKGAGSVVNGYESIAGQINTELKKPSKDDKVFINLYGSRDGRFEFNTHLNHIINDKWSTGMYVHANQRNWKIDNNNDHFIDNPLANQINFMNRWQYTNTESGWVSFFNIRYLTDKKQAGEMDFDPETDKLTTNAWGSEINTERFEVSNKTGFVFKDLPYKTMGLQTSYSNHSQKAYYGLQRYDIKHQSLYANFVYNSILSNIKNKFKAGISTTFDQYDEFVLNQKIDRTESGIGVYFEYTYDNDDNFSIVAGIRGDTHNKLGSFLTPRIHMRYNPWKKGVLRASIGSGKRIANIFAENQQFFASSRTFNIINNGGKVYGLNPEKAWNYGVSFLQGFTLFDKKGDIGIDYFTTRFKNQAVVDVDSNTNTVSFYDLDGKSIAQSLQTDINYTPAKHFDLRFSYKYYDVFTDYTSGRLSKGLLAKHRILGNVSYETHFLNDKGSKWKFDFTWHWFGKQRIPNTANNPIKYQLNEFSNPFSHVNAQVTKVFSKSFEVYLGGENLFNYTQKQPIVAADDPFGSNFDSTLIYAPIFGTSIYTGLRLKIN